jgi:hypothetical protein
MPTYYARKRVDAYGFLLPEVGHHFINTGVHGSNGLNPKVSFKIYQCYVLPRLLYGLEILPLSKTHLDMLNKFHMKNLRIFY